MSSESAQNSVGIVSRSTNADLSAQSEQNEQNPELVDEGGQVLSPKSPRRASRAKSFSYVEGQEGKPVNKVMKYIN